MRRRKMMGDMAQDTFLFNLETYRKDMLDLYKKKSAMMSEREGLRFQYVSGTRTKLMSLRNSMLGDTMVTDMQPVQELLLMYLSALYSSIPMTDINGKETPGFLGYLEKYAGNVHLLAPINNWLTMPMGDGVDVPFYKQHIYYFVPMDGGSTNRMLSLNKMIERVLYPYYGSAKSVETGESIPVTVPPSLDYIKGLVGYQRAELANEYGALVSLINKNYPEGNLKDLYNLAISQFKKIATLTYSLVILQIEIDAVEEQFFVFVSDYNTFTGQNLDANQILEEIRNPKPVVVPQEIPVGATVVPDIADKGMATTTTAPVLPAPEKKSKTLLYAGLAAGIFLLTK